MVDSERVNELPLNGRNFLQLALLAAGANEAVGRANPAGQVGHPGRSAVIGGVKAANNGYMINGIQGPRGRGWGELAVKLVGCQRRRVQGPAELLFMPDEGPNPAIVSVNTKSGGKLVPRSERSGLCATWSLTRGTSSRRARRI